MISKNTNKKVGNSFELFFCELLSFNGFWAHNAAQNQAGQPADVIAARNGRAYLIDCKVIENGVFPFEHIEDNQESAMELWKQSGNGEGWFAFKFNDGRVYMMTLSALQEKRKKQSRLKEIEIRLYGMPLSEWVERCE